MSNKVFISGNEAIAEGVRLVSPNVISAYPITPQTTVVERLSEMVAENNLSSEFIHVESEHSALSACIGASAMGVRTFTATSSQGLLYMSECLHYASGGRFPIVMMNANRSVALPWSIYGDHRDSLSQLDSGWIQLYVEDAQESLDMLIQSFYIAENQKVLTPVMINLDGFILTHTYEVVDIPNQEDVKKFLKPFETENKMDFLKPKNMAFSSSPQDNMEFKYQQNQGMLAARDVIKDGNELFSNIFGRDHGELTENYRTEDADFIVLAIGSVVGTCRDVVDELRKEGKKVGLIKIRFMRPFPEEEILYACSNAKAIGVIDKDISFGYEGTVYTNVCSALSKSKLEIEKLNFIAGLGGRDISKENIKELFNDLEQSIEGIEKNTVKFLGLGVVGNDNRK